MRKSFVFIGFAIALLITIARSGWAQGGSGACDRACLESLVEGVYPFTDDCNRIENGSLSTNVTPREGETRPDPKTSNWYFVELGLQRAVRIRIDSFRVAHPRSAVRGRGS